MQTHPAPSYARYQSRSVVEAPNPSSSALVPALRPCLKAPRRSRHSSTTLVSPDARCRATPVLEQAAIDLPPTPHPRNAAAKAVRRWTFPSANSITPGHGVLESLRRQGAQDLGIQRALKVSPNGAPRCFEPSTAAARASSGSTSASRIICNLIGVGIGDGQVGTAERPTRGTKEGPPGSWAPSLGMASVQRIETTDPRCGLESLV